MERIIFDKGDLYALFGKIKSEMTLAELSHKLGISYNTLKQWKSGKHAMPFLFFQELKKYFPNIEQYENRCKKIDAYFGQKLGGSNRIKKLNKTALKDMMANIRSKRHFDCFSKINIYSNPEAIEFYGAMMGDGCISRFYSNYEQCFRHEIRITGNSKKDMEYIAYLVKLMQNVFGISPYIHCRKHICAVDLVSRNKGLFEWLETNRFPVGKKKELVIPKTLFRLNSEILVPLIRGLFDTDGCLSARKDEKYKYPYIFISTNSSTLRFQVKHILRELGLPAYIHSDNIVVRGMSNCRHWFRIIGSNNPRNINKYNQWLKTGRIGPVV